MGLTTAAAVWAACGLGIAAGFGAYALVGAGTAVVLVVLVVFPRLDITEIAHDVRRYKVIAPYREEGYEAYVERFTAAGLHPRRKSMKRDGGEMTVVWEVLGSPEDHRAVTEAFLSDPGVTGIDVR